MNRDVMSIAMETVKKWETLAIATTDIDGPLSTFAKGSLIRIISEALENHRPVLQPDFGPEKRKVGRPRKVCRPISSPPEP